MIWYVTTEDTSKTMKIKKLINRTKSKVMDAAISSDGANQLFVTNDNPSANVKIATDVI